ncbi:MAG TPA: Tim44-like domain-containing protein [Ramlibacter sp.]|nr:Tim44-like domain-containing protein [Ramlibacter sp.]
MKKALAIFAVVMTVGMTMALDAEAARRLGGGGSSGMQRQAVTAPAPSRNAPAQAAPNQAAPNQAAAAPGAAAAAQPRRSWMGPIAGLAAGLGLAALASHFGFGAALANFMLFALLGVAVLAIIAFVMRKRAAGQQTPALAGMGRMGTGDAGGWQGQASQPDTAQRSGLGEAPAGGSLIGSRIGAGIGSGLAATATGAEGTVGNIPADFDVQAFARNAQANFMALQAANDARDLTRLREYLTPEMFEAARADIQSRDTTPQQTQVFGLNAQVLDVAEEGSDYVVSVRFTGSVREAQGADTEDLNEIWHLTKPRAGAGGWQVAGIQQG